MVDLNKNQLLTIATVLIICAFFGNGTYQECLSSLQNIVIREGESALLSCSVAPNGIQWSVTPTSNSTRTYIIVAYNGSVNPVLNGFYSYDPFTGLTVRSGTTYATGYDIATAGVYFVNFNASNPSNRTAFKVVVIRSGPDCSCTQLSNGSVTVSCAMVYADHPARNTEINEVMSCTANGQQFSGTTAPRIQVPSNTTQYVWNQTSSFTTTDTGPTTYNCTVSFSKPPSTAPAYLANNTPSYSESIPVFCGTTTTMLTTTTQLTTTTKSPTTTSKPLSTAATTAGPTTTQPTTTKTTPSVTTTGPTTSRPATTPGPTTPGPTTPGPTTPGPTTTGSTTTGPTTPGPTTSQPATTPGPTTPGPTTPRPTTPGPTTGPTTPGPTTPGPTTPGPTTPGPTTPGPTTPGPTISQPATTTGPTTPGPTASQPATTPGPTTPGPTTPGPTISQSEKTPGLTISQPATTSGPTASASQQASPISTSEATLPSASTQSTTTVVIPSVATTEPLGATTQSTTTTTTPTAINATSVSPIPEVTTSVGPTPPSTAPLSSTPPLVLNPTTSPPTLTIPLATAGQPTSSTTVNIGLLSTKIVLGTVLGVLMAATALLGCCWGFLYCCPLFSAVAPARLPTQYIVDEVQWLPRRDWIPVPREMHYRVIPFYKQSFCKCPTPLEYRLPKRGGCVTDFQRPARMAPPPPRLTYVYEDTCA